MPEPRDSTAPAPTGLDDNPDRAPARAHQDGQSVASYEPGLIEPILIERRHSDPVDRLRNELVESRRGLVRFENLFRISPIPIMEQDYTVLVEWMERLRAQGVEDIVEYLGEDIEAIRAVVPMIRIVAANPAAMRAVGVSADRLIGPIDPAIVNVEAGDSWRAQLKAVWERQPVAHASFVARSLDGRTYDAESTLAAPLIDGEPDFSRAVFTIVDVTEHRAEERRMEELVSAKSQFVASVSHEIRTPLTAIVGFAQILEDDDAMGPEERRQLVAAIGQQAREVTDLVDDLLVATRVELGQIDVHRLPVDIEVQIAETLATGGSYATGVSLDGMSAPVLASGDPARIRQILRNLLTNAERYGGPDVRIGVSADAETVRVDVSDDGPGLPGADWDRVFEPYQRSSSMAVSPASVGIGLAISRQLAVLMGGSLAYDRVGGRSVFRLGLPRA